jgi:hypothetical protein
VINSFGQQLLSNGDFSQGTLVDWVYCNPNNATFAGTVTSACGSDCYQDGSVGAPDYLSQTFNVQPNNVYTVSFWLTVLGNYTMLAWVTVSA